MIAFTQAARRYLEEELSRRRVPPGLALRISARTPGEGLVARPAVLPRRDESICAFGGLRIFVAPTRENELDDQEIDLASDGIDLILGQANCPRRDDSVRDVS